MPSTSSSKTPDPAASTPRRRLHGRFILSGALVVAILAGTTIYLVAISSDPGPAGPGPSSTATLPREPAGASVDGVAVVGSVAPDFDLPELSGDGSVRLAELAGQPVVVNFWASWCVPCRQEFPLLQQAERDYRDQGLVIIGIDFRDIAADARSFAEEQGATWSLVTDPDRETAKAYGVRAIPQTFFIYPDGTIAQRYFSTPANQAAMNREIENILP